MRGKLDYLFPLSTYINSLLRRDVSEQYSPNNPAPYVVLLCWIHCKGATLRHYLPFFLIYCTSYFLEQQCIAFIDNVLARETIQPKQYAVRCYTALQEQDLLDEQLWALLITMSRTFIHPRIQEARRNILDMSLVALYAAQRQVCSGEEKHV